MPDFRELIRRLLSGQQTPSGPAMSAATPGTALPPPAFSPGFPGQNVPMPRKPPSMSAAVPGTALPAPLGDIELPNETPAAAPASPSVKPRPKIRAHGTKVRIPKPPSGPMMPPDEMLDAAMLGSPSEMPMPPPQGPLPSRDSVYAMQRELPGQSPQTAIPHQAKRNAILDVLRRLVPGV